MNRNISEEDLVRQIQKDAETTPVPDSLKPEAMRKTLEAAILSKPEKSGKPLFYRLAPALTAAACFIFAASVWRFGPLNREKQPGPAEIPAGQQTTDIETEEEKVAREATGSSETVLPQTASSYDEIYKIILSVQERRENLMQYNSFLAEAEAGAGNSNDTGTAIQEKADAEESGRSFSTTNLQAETVDEEDIVKTDGTYLYHLVRSYEKSSGDCHISIVKASGANMEEISIIQGLDNISGFYLQGDTLVCVEQIWLETRAEAGAASFLKRLAGSDSSDSYSRAASRVTFFDISDRSQPRKINSLTTDGYTAASRISDGYFYLISQYTPPRKADGSNPRSFIPIINGAVMEAASIILPENADTDSYLVAASISLEDPSKFTDSKAILSSGNQFYVSPRHIYVADTQYRGNGLDSSITNLTMFSYEDGRITGQKSGTIKGEILDPFAMNEYNGYFRVAVTVDSCDVTEITDDLTGKSLGYYYENETRTNSLYVLDDNLNVTGKIEGLAENERIYSARFMGDTGYFVTFRQIDPLFSVDLSDPQNPKILGELKISGFSEYLHFYSENLLLGIGREVDPDSLRSKGLKLSMFDISDPSNVKEIDKLVFEEIDYTDAYYDYKAVLIDPKKNLFGFPCEGTDRDRYTRQYRTFSYDPEKGFTEGIRWTEAPDRYTQARGAFIGEIFYVLRDNGDITAYHLDSGREAGQLKRKEE